MNIICSHQFRMLLSSMNGYEMDLGMSYSSKDDRGNLQQDIKDAFILKVKKETGTVIYKVAVMGILSIYTNSNMSNDEVWVYNGSDIQIINYDINEAKLNIERCLAEIIKQVK